MDRDDHLELPQSRPDFDDLNRLRVFLETILDTALPTLELYSDPVSGGFYHFATGNTPGDFGMASTGTCVAFVVDSGKWAELEARTPNRAALLMESIKNSKWDSAEIGPGNPFATSFILEAIQDLKATGVRSTPAQLSKARTHLRRLLRDLEAGAGIGIRDSPPTAFVTYKALRALSRWGSLSEDVRQRTSSWAWGRLYEQSVNITVGGTDADPFDAAYAALVVSLCNPLRDMSPRHRSAFTHSIDQFFAAQLPTGNWPRSQPLFLYPPYGNAYCYDYEFLTSLLSDEQLRPVVQNHIGKLTLAALSLEDSRIPLGDASSSAGGWSTGHLRQEVTRPESWASASVFHFCLQLRRLVVEAIRQTLFERADARYSSSVFAKPATGSIPKSFLDSEIERGAHKDRLSLVSVLTQHFLVPIMCELPAAQRGHSFSKSTPTSAILYGPPGTSKTELAKLVADALSLPLLKLDPSHLTRNGLEGLHAETYRLFRMLEAAELMVVLFDEFDELVRERDVPGSESVSRFLTTAMLPKLAALSERRRILYILATNHLERFDTAISRPGRFDLIVPVMPPTLESKLQTWPQVGTLLKAYGVGSRRRPDIDLRRDLADLTYLEFKSILPVLDRVRSRSELEQVISDAASRATMNQTLGDSAMTWRQLIEGQQEKIRIPAA